MPRRKPPAKTEPKPKLTPTEEDLLAHLENGYQLESSSLERGPLLRNLKDNSLVRATSANQGTIRALEERGLVHAKAEGLTTIWRATNRSKELKKSE